MATGSRKAVVSDAVVSVARVVPAAAVTMAPGQLVSQIVAHPALDYLSSVANPTINMSNQEVFKYCPFDRIDKVLILFLL